MRLKHTIFCSILLFFVNSNYVISISTKTMCDHKGRSNAFFKPIDNCTQCITKTKATTGLEIEIAICKVEKDEKYHEQKELKCEYCECNYGHRFNINNDKCTHVFQDTVWVTMFNYAYYVPLYIFALYITIKLHCHKLSVNVQKRPQFAQQSRLRRLSIKCTASCVGNRVIIAINCLIAYLSLQLFRHLICGVVNENYIISVFAYLIIITTSTKCLMLASIFVITSWAKTTNGLVKHCYGKLPNFITSKAIGFVLKLVVFVSWCIYPMARIFGKEYVNFHYYFNLIFLVTGGTFALFYGGLLTHWLKRVAGRRSIQNTTQKKQFDLAVVMSRYLVGIGLYVVFMFVYYLFMPSTAAVETFINIFTLRHLHLFLVYCLLRIFEAKVESNLFLCGCCSRRHNDVVLSSTEEISSEGQKQGSMGFDLEVN